MHIASQLPGLGANDVNDAPSLLLKIYDDIHSQRQ